MPRVARFRCAAVADLFRQLQYAPRSARTRQMSAAEALVADVLPEVTYPDDFVVFRITGYRPDDPGPTIPGTDLIADLATFVQRLSDQLTLGWDHDGREAITLEEAARILRVSTKSVQRYRRHGLVCHYVEFGERPPGGRRLACFRDALAAFQNRAAGRLDRAASFTRIPADTRRAIIDEARELHAQEGLSLNASARRLAVRHERAHETVRMILLTHDRRAATPIFAATGPMSARDRALVLRAWRRGVPERRLCARFGKSPATMRRALCRARGDRLRRYDLHHVALSTFDLVDAETVILSAAPLAEGLIRPPWHGDALALLAAARRPAVDADRINARLAGYNMLKRRAAVAVAALERHAPRARLDRIETDLRWASAIKRAIVADALPAAMHRAEVNFGRPLEGLPADRIVAIVRRTVDLLADEAEHVDPSRGQRYVRRSELAIDRAMAREDRRADAGRAAARHAGVVALPGLLRDLTPWEGDLDLRRDLEPAVPALAEPTQAIVVNRYGLAGAPPRTIGELATARGRSRRETRNRLREAIVELRAHVRGEIR